MRYVWRAARASAQTCSNVAIGAVLVALAAAPAHAGGGEGQSREAAPARRLELVRRHGPGPVARVSDAIVARGGALGRWYGRQAARTHLFVLRKLASNEKQAARYLHAAGRVASARGPEGEAGEAVRAQHAEMLSAHASRLSADAIGFASKVLEVPKAVKDDEAKTKANVRSAGAELSIRPDLMLRVAADLKSLDGVKVELSDAELSRVDTFAQHVRSLGENRDEAIFTGGAWVRLLQGLQAVDGAAAERMNGLDFDTLRRGWQAQAVILAGSQVESMLRRHMATFVLEGPLTKPYETGRDPILALLNDGTISQKGVEVLRKTHANGRYMKALKAEFEGGEMNATSRLVLERRQKVDPDSDREAASKDVNVVALSDVLDALGKQASIVQQARAVMGEQPFDDMYSRQKLLGGEGDEVGWVVTSLRGTGLKGGDKQAALGTILEDMHASFDDRRLENAPWRKTVDEALEGASRTVGEKLLEWIDEGEQSSVASGAKRSATAKAGSEAQSQ